jgi:RHS repeat-associated protein
VLIINSSGTVIENNRTLPYGEAWLAENTPSTNDKKFTTYQRDQESGLDYAMGRHYANTSARFVSVDKGAAALWAPQTLNRYSYAGNDPINNLDPDGNQAQCIYANNRLLCILPPPVWADMALVSLSSGPMGSWGIMIAMGFVPAQAPAITPEQAAAEQLDTALRTAVQFAMVRIGAYGRFANDEQSRTMTAILGRVASALTNSDCAGLFGGGDQYAALRHLAQASFSYAANARNIDQFGPGVVADIARLATNPGNDVARALIGVPIGFVNDNFFDAFSNSPDRGATVIIHELMHMFGYGTSSQPGRGDIDTNIRDNYADISQKCGTGNPLQ